MKQLKLLIAVVLGTIFIMSASCRDKENCHDTIFIQNNSDKAIYFDNSFRYPDTTIQDDGVVLNPYTYKIDKSSRKISFVRGCYEGILKSSYPKVMIFIFDAHTLETNPYDTVAKRYMVLKRYDLSLQDLQRMNWTITYP